jgi:hypothetical protein
MSIYQVSKIQVRSGNLADLPQLDEAEFGWATDNKRLFIGKTTPNENIEVLTSYSNINFNQIDGTVGNLNINATSLAAGQVLTYDGNNWINHGGNAGGTIDLGNVANVKISGGAISYVLQTDGLGNLSWTPKTTTVATIQTVSQANPGVVTTSSNNFFVNGDKITITNASGMTQLNGNVYYVKPLTSNTFSLYSDSGLTSNVNTTSYNAYSYTTVTGTTTSVNTITVGNSALFTTNQPVQFIGSLSTSGLTTNNTYYIKTIPDSTHITVSYELLANGTAGNTQALTTTTGLTANVFVNSGRAVASVSTSGSSNGAQGSNLTVQFNNNNLLNGNANFTYDYVNNLLTVNGGNANVGNLNATSVVSASRYISNVATGTTPLQVVSTTRVPNLNVAYSNVTDFVNVSTATSGTFYPILANAVTGNVAELANSNLSFNAATGNLSTVLLNVSGNANVGNIGATNGVFTNVSGNGSSLSSLTGANVTGQVANAAIAGTVYTNAQPNITSVGTLTSLAVTGNISAGNANLGNLIIANYHQGTLTTGAQPNITSVGTLTSLSVTGNASAGNISTAGVLSVTGNANVGNLSAVSNISAAYFLGNGSQLTGIVSSPGNSILNGNSNVTVVTNGNVNISATGVANVVTVSNTGANITGTLNTTGNANVGNIGATNANITAMTATGNISAGNISTNGILSVTGNANVGNLGTTGNITAGYFFGNGSGLTGISVAAGNTIVNGNSNVSVLANSNVLISVNGTSNVVVVTTTGMNVAGTLNATGNLTSGNASLGNLAAATYLQGTLITASQPNITSVGTLTSATVTGNITAGNVYANSGTVNATLLTGTLTTFAQPNITSVGTLTSLTVSGNIISGNIYSNTGIIGASLLTGTITTNAQPNITSVGTMSNLTVTGNIIFGNVTGGNLVSANYLTGTLTTAIQPNITVLGTLANLTVTGNSVMSYVISSVSNPVTATGTIQSNATPLTSVINVVSSVAAGTGVLLPVAPNAGGIRVTIMNTSANSLNVYPASNAAINSNGANVAYVQSAGAKLDYVSVGNTQWYTLNAT